MSSVPSPSRIAFWKGVSRQLDSLFGYRHDRVDGPCGFVIESLMPDEVFTDLVSSAFVEDFLEAMKAIQRGTKINLFLRHESPELNRFFDLWWVDVDDKCVKKRGHLTDDVRQAYLDTAFSTKLFELDPQALKQSHEKLREALDSAPESSPEWGAMCLILRIYEAAVVHVARNHLATRTLLEGELAHDPSKRAASTALAREQALAANLRWQRALGQCEPKQPHLRLLRGDA